MKASPTARSLTYCRNLGITAAVTERWNPHARIRQDLFGFIDIIAIHPPDTGTLAIQATTGANLAARRSKILTDPKVSPCASLWLRAGNRIQVWGWAKQGPRGKPKRWTLRIEEITAADFPLDNPQSASVGSSP